MKLKWLGLAAFPTILLGLLIAERLSSYLLGYYPANEAMWAIVLELRMFCRDLSNVVASLCNQSMAMQLVLLAGMAAAVIGVARARMHKTSFVIQHVMLLVAAAATMLTGDAYVAVSGEVNLIDNFALKLGTMRTTWLHVTIISAGLIGCAYCHLAMLAELRRPANQVAARLRELQLEA